MNCRSFTYLLPVSLAVALHLCAPPAFSQPPAAQTTIYVTAANACTIDDERLDCDQGGGTRGYCRNNQQVWWTVDNQMERDVVVAILNFKVGDYYVDPLIGPGNNRDHYVAVAASANEILRTRVGKIDNAAFKRKTYKYDIAVSLDGGATFTVCRDPRLDIDG